MATNKELALQMFPHLIRWAQGAWNIPHYYSDLAACINHHSNQIGAPLGIVQDILDELASKHHKTNVPTLNCLVQSKKNGVPSYGFEYVAKRYNDLSDEEKKALAAAENKKAHDYDWSWVIDELNLKIIPFQNNTEPFIFHKNSKGGEGAEHKAIKEYVMNHPTSVGIRLVKNREKEHPILSGDRVDVYFECGNKKHYAVEIKPSSSDEADILRGIFQCVKYKAVMDAERVRYGGNYENDALLVIAGTMSSENKQTAIDLGLKYIENFKYN